MTNKNSSNKNNLAKAVEKKIGSRKFKIICICLAFIFLAIVVFVGWYTEKEYGWISNLFRPDYKSVQGELAVHFVDVGQGDAIIIELPDDKKMLIDGGPGKSKNTLKSYIDYLNIEKFDYVMLTHSDEDHVGGLINVVEKYEVETFYVPKVTTSQIGTQVYSNFVDAMNKEGAEIIYSSTECSIFEENYSIYFITPEPDRYDQKFSTAAQKNSISPIIILEFGKFKIMFTGDATSNESEKWFDAAVKNNIFNLSLYDVDVLKVAHHGGKDSTAEEFLEVVRAEYFVISVGKGNTYGHPHADLLTRLELSMNDNSKHDKGVFRTDKNGNVLLRVDDEGQIEWKTAS